METASIYYLVLFILGTFFGSFLNVISDRLPKKESVLFGRSKCDFCKKKLKPKHLIPLLSFLFQRGKCGYCKKRLTFLYPLSEALTGFAFVGAAYLSGLLVHTDFASIFGLLFYILVLSFYIVMFLTDYKECLIPDVIVFPAIIFVLVSLVATRAIDLFTLYKRLSGETFGTYLIKAGYFDKQLWYAAKDVGYILVSALIISLFFYFLVWVTKGKGMGGGDVKLGFLIGLVNGFPHNIVAIFLGFVLGAVYSLLLIGIRKKTLKDTIAFGPFLITASLITLFYGADILNWYINLF
ncbi:prepilin peptidase [Patescibacteria group bacterium]